MVILMSIIDAYDDDDDDVDYWFIRYDYNNDDDDDDDGRIQTVMTAVRKMFAATWATVGRKPADVESRLSPDGGYDGG